MPDGWWQNYACGAQGKAGGGTRRAFATESVCRPVRPRSRSASPVGVGCPSPRSHRHAQRAALPTSPPVARLAIREIRPPPSCASWSYQHPHFGPVTASAKEPFRPQRVARPLLRARLGPEPSREDTSSTARALRSSPMSCRSPRGPFCFLSGAKLSYDRDVTLHPPSGGSRVSRSRPAAIGTEYRFEAWPLRALRRVQI